MARSTLETKEAAIARPAQLHDLRFRAVAAGTATEAWTTLFAVVAGFGADEVPGERDRVISTAT